MNIVDVADGEVGKNSGTKKIDQDSPHVGGREMLTQSDEPNWEAQLSELMVPIKFFGMAYV